MTGRMVLTCSQSPGGAILWRHHFNPREMAPMFYSLWSQQHWNYSVLQRKQCQCKINGLKLFDCLQLWDTSSTRYQCDSGRIFLESTMHAQQSLSKYIRLFSFNKLSQEHFDQPCGTFTAWITSSKNDPIEMWNMSKLPWRFWLLCKEDK